MREVLVDIAGLAGAALVALGAGMAYLPAGIITAGVMLVAAAYFTAKPERGEG